MRKIKLSQDENLSIKASFRLLPQEYQQLNLYISIPEEMGISSSTLSEENFFYSSIEFNSAYYSENLHLPLVRSRFISQQKGDQSDYRSNLNLFSYQLRIALETDIKQTIKITDIDEFYGRSIEIANQTELLLKKLRRYTPPDKKLSSYFENIDNFLSWKTEQSFLKLLSKSPKSSGYNNYKNQLLDLCKKESVYRIEKKYNSTVTLEDPNRITNKMQLLQRLGEYGVVFSKKTTHLNVNLKRLVRGSITAVIMAFVMYIVLNARTAFTEITIVLIAFLGFIYGVRETFKDELTSAIWRMIQRGRPKWRHVFSNSITKRRVSFQTIWLEYIKSKELPKEVDELFQRRRQQNKLAAHLLHFRCASKVTVKEFLPGYEEIQNQIIFNLTPFVRYLRKGEGRLYNLEGNKVSSEGVEKRYQLNMVLVQKNNKNQHHVQRIKITMNRSKIINIEAVESEDNL